MNPAKRIIKKFGEGGASFIAGHLEINRSTVCRWAKSKVDGGTGGLIPAQYHKKLIKLAKKNKINLTAADLVG